jgi:hypothetical protein
MKRRPCFSALKKRRPCFSALKNFEPISIGTAAVAAVTDAATTVATRLSPQTCGPSEILIITVLAVTK